jgi:hypothetical protein
MPPSSVSQARHLLPQAGEGQKPQATRVKDPNSLLLMLGEAVSPEAVSPVRCVLKPSGSARQVRFGTKKKVRFETKKGRG